MAPPLLFMRYMKATPEVQRYVGATATPVGNTFDNDEDPGAAGSNDRELSPRNRVINVLGNIYAVANLGVYKLQPDGITFSNSSILGGLTFTTQSTDALTLHQRSGIHVIYIDTVPHIVGFYKTSLNGNGGAQIRGYKLNLSTNVWIEQSAVSTAFELGGDSGGFHNEIIFRDELHFSAASVDANGAILEFFRYNVSSNTLTRSTPPSDMTSRAYLMNYDWCIFNGRLFMLYATNNTAGVPAIAEYSNGVWQPLNILFAGTNTVSTVAVNGQSRWCLFTDGTRLYAIVLVNTGTNIGWRCFSIDATLITTGVTDITTTVLPVSLRSTDDGGAGVTGDGRIFAISDISSAPSALDVWLYHASSAAPANTYDLYAWNGNAAVIGAAGLPDDTGGDVAHSVPSISPQGGDRQYTPGNLSILITGASAAASGELIKFKAGGDPGFGNKIVTFYLNRENEPPIGQATLTGTPFILSGSPAALPTRNVNQLEDIDADSTVEYATIWNISADTVVSGDRAILKPYITP